MNDADRLKRQLATLLRENEMLTRDLDDKTMELNGLREIMRVIRIFGLPDKKQRANIDKADEATMLKLMKMSEQELAEALGQPAQTPEVKKRMYH